jgi:hypothetical protein
MLAAYHLRAPERRGAKGPASGGAKAGAGARREKKKMGRLIPAGTASSTTGTCESRQKACRAVAAEQRRRETTAVGRETGARTRMEYFVTPEEAFTRDEIE